MQQAGKSVHHNIFDHAKSHTFKPSDGQHWNITYGDGSSASGTVGTDVVSIGGVEVKNQAVELANKLSPEFQQSAGDGLCGLAWVSEVPIIAKALFANDNVGFSKHCDATPSQDTR